MTTTETTTTLTTTEAVDLTSLSQTDLITIIQTQQTLIDQIRSFHQVPGLKDAEILEDPNKPVRSISTTADLKKALRNAQRQARRRTARLEAKLLTTEAIDLEALDEALEDIPVITGCPVNGCLVIDEVSAVIDHMVKHHKISRSKAQARVDAKLADFAAKHDR